MIESMKKTLIVMLGIFFIPSVAAAAASVQNYLRGIARFLNNTVVPLFFALAFLFFLVNVVRYFIIGGANEDARKKARLLALWGIIAFVLMVSIWGIVNLLVVDFGIENYSWPVCPDFLPPGYCSGGPIT